MDDISTPTQHAAKMKLLRLQIACLSSTQYIALLSMLKKLNHENFTPCEPLVTAALLTGVIESVATSHQSTQLHAKNQQKNAANLLAVIQQSRKKCLKTTEDAQRFQRYLHFSRGSTGFWKTPAGIRLIRCIAAAQILIVLLAIVLGAVQKHHMGACARAQFYRFVLIDFAHTIKNAQAEAFFRNAPEPKQCL